MTPLAGGIPDSILSVLQVAPGPDLAEVEGTRGQALAAFGGTQSLHPVSDRVIPGVSPARAGETQGPEAALPETRARLFLLGSTRTLQGPVLPEKLRGQDGSLGTEVLGLQVAGCASAAYPWLTCSLRRIRSHRRLPMTSDTPTSVPGRKRTREDAVLMGGVEKQGCQPLRGRA